MAETKDDSTAVGSSIIGQTKTQYKVRQADFSWRNLTVKVPAGGKKKGEWKTILDNSSGVVKPGEVVAIMGPSGSGKTTLLNALAGKFRAGRTSGQILLDGKPRDSQFKRLTSYVPQENSLMGILTVKETMKYAAKLSGATDPGQINEMMTDTLNELGMTDTLDTRVGDLFFKGLSGGQQRRLAIGVELLKQPSLLLLDEPTSSLDSASAAGVIEAVKDLASAGRTVLMTIHQPGSDLFFSFDKVMFLTKGRTVYFGPTSTVVDYFSRLGHACPRFTNPADYFMLVINTDFPGHGDLDALVDNYDRNLLPDVEQEAAKLDESHATFAGHARLELARADANALEPFQPNPGKDYATSYLQQFLILSHRSLVTSTKSPMIYGVRLVMYTMLSIMIGTMFLGQDNAYETIQDRFALLFWLSAFFVFMSVAALPFFISNRAVFVRETSNGAYSIGPYVLSTVVTALPFIAIITLIASTIVYFLADLNSEDGRYGVFLADMYLTLVVAELFSYIVAAIAPHYIVAIAGAAACYGAFMAAEGFMMQKERIPGWWIWLHYIAFHTPSFRIFIFNEFDGQQFECPEYALRSNPSCVLDGTNDILSAYNMEDTDVGMDFLNLVIWAVACVMVLYAILRYQYPSVVPTLLPAEDSKIHAKKDVTVAVVDPSTAQAQQYPEAV